MSIKPYGESETFDSDSLGRRLIKMPCVDDLVKLYFGIGLSNKEILPFLSPKHNVVICVRTLKKLCRKLVSTEG